MLFCFGLGLRAQDGFHLTQNRKRGQIPFELVNNLPVIKVNINGVDLSFILDTGVKSTILFSMEDIDNFHVGPTVPVQMMGLGPDGYLDGLKSSHNIIKVGKAMDIDHELFLIFDSALNFSPRMGIPIHGILGNEFFKNFVVKLNYASKTITFYDQENHSFPKCRKCTDLPLDLIQEKPYITLFVSDGKKMEEATLLVDSGSSDVLWLFEEENYISEDPKNYFRDFLGLGLGGKIYGKRGRVAELFLGPFILKDVLTSFPEEKSTVRARLVESRDGSVGGGFLSRFNITIDYGNNRIRFKKNFHFDDPFNYNMSGITLEHSGMDWLIGERQFSLVPRYVVVDVRAGSPAQLAGIQKGDEVITINGRPNYSYKLYELTRLFSNGKKSKITMEIKRGNLYKTYKFVLKSEF